MMQPAANNYWRHVLDIEGFVDKQDPIPQAGPGAFKFSVDKKKNWCLSVDNTATVTAEDSFNLFCQHQNNPVFGTWTLHSNDIASFSWNYNGKSYQINFHPKPDALPAEPTKPANPHHYNIHLDVPAASNNVFTKAEKEAQKHLAQKANAHGKQWPL